MKLKEIIETFEPETLEICAKDSWDNYDSIVSESELLKFVSEHEVVTAEAVDNGIIRVVLKWQ